MVPQITEPAVKTKRGSAGIGALSVFLKCLAASRMARNASPGEETLWQKGRKPGSACLCSCDRFAVTKARVSSPLLHRVPGHPQGFWLAEPLPGTAAEKTRFPRQHIPQGTPWRACF